MKLILINISIILIFVVSFINAQNPNCAIALAPWFKASGVGIQLTMVDASGLVVYAKGSSSNFMNTYLFTTNSYGSLYNNATNCNGPADDSSTIQPFAAAKAGYLFNDKDTFSIAKDGKVHMVLAAPMNQGIFDFYLSDCKSNLMTGFSDNRVFVLHFSLNQYSVLGQEKCGDVAKSPYTTPSSAPTQPPAAVSTSTTGSTPAPVSTTTTTTTTTTGPSTSTSAPKVAFSSTLKGSWSEGGIQYTQWDSSVINTGTTAISHLIITSTMTLKDSASLWRLDIVAPGQYTPSFVQTINPNESYDFSFIKSGSDAPSFNVQ